MDESQIRKAKIAATLFLTAIGIVSFFFLFGCGMAGDDAPFICIFVKIFYYLFYFPFLIISSNDLMGSSLEWAISFALVLSWSYLLVSIIAFLLRLFRKIRK